MISDLKYIHRCIELAQNGSGFTYPNPLVGAVLVYDDKIIGEGYHHAFGKEHAEVNAINQCINNGNEHLIDKSILYVNLEPCTHSGKTPPCCDLIIKYKIPRVVIGCNDPFHEVNGAGVEKLMNAGIEVVSGILENECTEVNRRFITYHTKKRPYIILKYAQTANHLISQGPLSKLNIEHPIRISNKQTDILVHKWRSEEAAILVGTKTAEIDNPFLTVRKWHGNNPLRIVIDKNLRLRKDLNLFDHSTPTLVINAVKNKVETNLEFVKIDFKENVINSIIEVLFEKKILSLIVEGGSNLLNQFIEVKLWDEARIITANKFFMNGVQAPKIDGSIRSSSNLAGDKIVILRP